MKRLGFLALLMTLSSSANAGGSVSFLVGGHRVQIESTRHCRAISCASVSVSGLNMPRRRDRQDVDRPTGEPVRTTAPATRAPSPPAPAVSGPPVATAAAPPPALYTPAAATTQIVAAPPPPAPAPPSPPVQPVAIPLPPPVAAPVEAAQPAPQVVRVSREVEVESADSPVGDWQTEGKGMVRIVPCGTALCGYVLDASSNDNGEAILINMKPKAERQWTGRVYSQGSGATYYGTIAIKGADTLRVEACALGRFYCSGNNWSRITSRQESIMTSRQVSAEPRS
ncbi:DUF2147 domain-containing protein [Bradyrhizobium sp.]|uniref:DUF2147 domain-containing protein n=1 Tax=Bradyrhizobium sp. TaxID=376 RepID=UPI0025BE9F91|nr:DUF2147 domain-containing protein [Bradyrhizobium sp.]